MVSAEGVAWFLIAEGTLTVQIYKRHDIINGLEYTAIPYTVITNGEIDLLNEIKKWLDFNQIKSYITKGSRKSSKLSKHDWYRLEVKNFLNVEKFLELILPYLCGKKKRCGELLLELCKKYRKKKGWNNKSTFNLQRERQRFLEMTKIHDEISSLTNRSFGKKYSVQYFKDLWGI